MERFTLSKSDVNSKSVKELAGLGDDDEMTKVQVECSSRREVSIRTIREWIQNGSGEVLATGMFQTGPAGLRIWEQAFSNFEDYDTPIHENRLSVFYDDGTPGPREPSITVSISEATVELSDGTKHDNVFYITFSRSAGTPDEVMIMKQ